MSSNMSGKSPTSMRSEGRKVRNLLRACLDPCDTSNFSVGCSGSAVVSWWDLERREVGSNRKHWLKWTPCDVDVFICGKHGSSVNSYNMYVSKAINKMKEIGHTISFLKSHTNYSVLEGVAVSIIDVEVEGIKTVISFIRAPGSSTVHDVVAKFSLDIVRMVYNFQTGGYIMSEEDRCNLDNGFMRVSQSLVDLLEGGVCTDFVISKLRSLYHLVDKYRARGFVLVEEEKIKALFEAFKKMHPLSAW